MPRTLIDSTFVGSTNLHRTYVSLQKKVRSVVQFKLACDVPIS